MWPWAHLAVGYLLYSGAIRALEDRPPAGAPAIAVAVGTQLPDLVDKPFGWTLSILPNGRSMGHSLLFAAVAIGLAYFVARRYDREDVAAAFGVGHLSHVFADYLLTVRPDDPGVYQTLFWPFLRVPPDTFELEKSFLAHFEAFSFTPRIITGFVLFGLAVGVWNRDGRPGLETLATVGRQVRRAIAARFRAG